MALLNGSSTRSMVFPHIMKTAGTSLISWIQRHYAYHEILLAATTWPELLRLPRGSLVGKKFVRGHFGSAIMKLFGEDKGFTPIAVLRDPVERVVSHFWHLKFSPEKHPFPLVRAEGFTIEQFIEDPATRCVVANYQTANFSATAESEPPTETPGELRVLEEVAPVNLEVAKAFVDSCAVVGVTEELPALMSRLSEYFGLFPEHALPKHRSYRLSTPVSDDVLQKIRALNEADFELYQYVRKRAETPRPRVSMAKPRNPNTVGDDGVLKWVAGMPYWGHGWSDVMADERNKHIWSLSPTATLEFAVRPGVCYTLVFTVQRFVTPLQKECFSVLSNGREISVISVFARGGDDVEVYAAVLAGSDTETLTIGFCVDTLFAFRHLSDDPSVLRRGVALSGVSLLACHPNAPPQALALEPPGHASPGQS